MAQAIIDWLPGVTIFTVHLYLDYIFTKWFFFMYDTCMEGRILFTENWSYLWQL